MGIGWFRWLGHPIRIVSVPLAAHFSGLMTLHASLTRLLAPIMLACALICSGCAGKYVPQQTVKLAVLDGGTVFEVAKGDEVTSEGWWFNQRDLIQSNNAHVLANEALSREFSHIPGVEVYSRSDMIVYLAAKERLIRKAYPKLSAADRAELLAAQNPVDFGKSLNVDYVLVPTVIQSATVQHGWSSIWSSRVELVLEMWSVESGNRVWNWTGKDRDYFDSQLRIMEELSRKAARKVKKRHLFDYPA